MNSLSRLYVFITAGLAFEVFLLGCQTQTRTSPPAPSSIGSAAPGMNITFLRWKEGMMVLFVDNAKGAHATNGRGATNNSVFTQVGSGGSAGEAQYRWQLDTTDGKTGKLFIDGKEYDLSKGELFVLKANGKQIEVHQLPRDLKTIPFDVDGCRDPIGKDAEIQKILGIGDLSI